MEGLQQLNHDLEGGEVHIALDKPLLVAYNLLGSGVRYVDGCSVMVTLAPG